MQSFKNDPKVQVSDPANFKLSDYETSYSGGLASDEAALELLKSNNKKLSKLQRKLYASDRHSILLIFQAMDAAGKDSTIRSVFSGVNPTGFQVSSFKAPSKEELDHDYLWRCQKALPERGRIGIFNRSHYEEVLVCKVHPEYVLGQAIPGITELSQLDDEFWNNRYQSIANWEKHLVNNGTVIIKFFLNVSKDQQKARFLSRINETKKNWKFSFGDLVERGFWPEYMKAYETAISKTSTSDAPWYVIPADNKTVMRAIVSDIVVQTLEELNLSYPTVSDKEISKMKEAKEILENED